MTDLVDVRARISGWLGGPRNAPGTRGALRGTNGGAADGTAAASVRAWWIAYLMIAGFVMLVCTVNAFSVLDERAWLQRPLASWEPFCWEYSSGFATIAFAWIPGLLIGRVPPSRGAAALGAHALGSLAFSACHVATMVVGRHLVYVVLARHYNFGGVDALLYEYRKDAVDYLLFACVFWGARHLLLHSARRPSPPDARRIDIVDGGRTIRAAVSDILALRSRGNYVEYLLADGRRPLARTTLAAVEEDLAGDGFVRVHRSFVVNRARIGCIEPEGSGDYRLTLSNGEAVPLSRRFRGALAALRLGA